MHRIILIQLFILFLFVFIGYILCRAKLIDCKSSSLISGLLVNALIPCMVIRTYSTHFRPENLVKNIKLLFIAICILGVTFVISYITAKCISKEKTETGIYVYSLSVPNYGYLGYALAEGLGGSELLMSVMVFALPVSVFSTTVGFNMLMNKKSKSIKSLFNIVTVSTLIGCVLGLAKIDLPAPLLTFLDKGSGCVAPLSMILLGIVIAEAVTKEVFSDFRIYSVSVIKLFFMPVVAIAVIYFLNAKDFMITALLVYAMPCGLNSIVVPKLYGGNYKLGASILIISNLMAIVTIPLLLGINYGG